MKHLTILFHLVVICLSNQCAKKPGKKFTEGALDSMYQKSDLVGQEFTVGSSSLISGQFISAAKAEEQTEGFKLLAYSNSANINSGDKVYFEIQKSWLRLFKTGESSPVAEWKIANHCNIENKRNDRGEETRYLTTECDDGLENYEKYLWIKTNIAEVNVRHIKQGTEHYKNKEEILNAVSLNLKGVNTFTIQTGKYIDRNIATSRTFDEKLQKFIIKGSSLSLARELVLPKDFDGYNILAPVEFSSNIPESLVRFNSDVLSDIEVLGAEDSEYEVQLKLTEHHLLVQKIVGLDGLSASERTYATLMDDGRYSVTLAGYPESVA